MGFVTRRQTATKGILLLAVRFTPRLSPNGSQTIIQWAGAHMRQLGVLVILCKIAAHCLKIRVPRRLTEITTSQMVAALGYNCSPLWPNALDIKDSVIEDNVVGPCVLDFADLEATDRSSSPVGSERQVVHLHAIQPYLCNAGSTIDREMEFE